MLDFSKSTSFTVYLMILCETKLFFTGLVPTYSVIVAPGLAL